MDAYFDKRTLKLSGVSGGISLPLLPLVLPLGV